MMPTTGQLLPPRAIHIDDDLSTFHSGEGVLDHWLRKQAHLNEDSGASRTYVLVGPGTQNVIGYYSLATGAVLWAQATGAIRRNMPEPIPVMILGRLAIDEQWQGRGLGRALLRDAILRTVQAAEIAGIRALLVHAISEAARRFYLQSGFQESPIDPLTLMLRLNDVGHIVAGKS